MIVYGDQSRRISPGESLACLAEHSSGGTGQTPIERHAWLVAGLIECGQIVQAIADRDASETGHDRLSAGERAMTALTCRLAAAVGTSWQDGFATAPPLRATDLRLDGAMPQWLEVREPEGFAHYAVYPEAYWRAAAMWWADAGLRAAKAPQVIGIRSIGTSLSAMVAAATGAESPRTVRPVGHPFDRRLELDGAAKEALRADAGCTFAIVDEGPGLSGSSFGAVADLLGQCGVPAARMAFFPSHGNEPGPMASARHRATWRSVPRHVTAFEDLVLQPSRPDQRLDTWFTDLTGPAEAPLVDVGGGQWRALRADHPADAPPADAAGERRKFLLRSGRGEFLIKFTGLGRSGMQRFGMHKLLGAAGLTTAPLGWRHGFTVEPWRRDLRPLRPTDLDPSMLVERLGAYLGFRAARLPAEGRTGASPAALLDMVSVNSAEALGAEAARTVDRLRGDLDGLGRKMCRVMTDNRLQPWEWLVAPDGRLIKTDAVDHHAGHDLVGCQDIAWDVAGAAVEFDLSPDQADGLRRIVSSRAERPVDPEVLAFCRLAYAAFQLGAARRAADRSQDADRQRWVRQETSYTAELATCLEQGFRA